jgi:hypothetical protein
VTVVGSGQYVIVDVENGPDAFTTVRIFNDSGIDQEMRMSLFSSTGTLLAHCENPRFRYGHTIDWCIRPGDFGADRFATLRIVTNGGCPGCTPDAVSAYVTKVIQP